MFDFENKLESISNKNYKRRKSPLRTIVKEKGKLPENAKLGKVIAAIGKAFLVKPLNSKNNQEPVECIAAGALISENPNSTIVVVGDDVYYTLEKKIGNIYIGTIHKVLERKNCFSRMIVGKEKAEQVIASNIDKLIIFMSADKPIYNRRLIDRLLVAAELNVIKPIICINKIDLFDSIELKEDFTIYKDFGIEVFFISALKNINLVGLEKNIAESNNVLFGPSGTGKSTLLNRILGKEIQAVQIISSKTTKGKHTTSAVRSFELPFGGTIIDTPGIREFGIWGLQQEELPLYFHEFDKFNPECKYFPCTHIHEPNCAVKQAYEDGFIDPQRYESYLNIFESLVE